MEEKSFAVIRSHEHNGMKDDLCGGGGRKNTETTTNLAQIKYVKRRKSGGKTAG